MFTRALSSRSLDAVPAVAAVGAARRNPAQTRWARRGVAGARDLRRPWRGVAADAPCSELGAWTRGPGGVTRGLAAVAVGALACKGSGAYRPWAASEVGVAAAPCLKV